MNRFHRVKTPTIIQMEAVECGAVSLGIILSYYKKYIPQDELRALCGVSRDGSNAFQIVNAARSLGLNVDAYQKETKELLDLKPPFIVFWNFNHFLVVEGFGRKKCFLNDPASGPRAISYEEFDESFSNVAITLEPTAGFLKSGNPPTIFPSLKERLKGMKGTFAYLLLASLGIVLSSLAIPLFIQLFFDQILPKNVSFPFFFFGFLTILFLSGAFSFLQKNILAFLNTKLSIRLSGKFFFHLLRLPLSFFVSRYPGELANRFSSNDLIIQSLTGQMVVSLINLLFVLFYFLVVVKISPLISFVALGSVAINLLFLRWISRARKDSYARLLQDFGKSIGISVGAIKNIETLKSFGMEGGFFSRWAGYFTKAGLSFQDINLKDVFLTTVPYLMQMLTAAAVLTIGTYEVIHSSISIGLLLALQVLVLNFLTPFTQFINLSQILGQVKGDLNRAEDVLKNHTDSIFQKRPPSKKLKLEGRLDLKGVSFGYNCTQPPFLNKIHINLESGKSLALIGPTGGGKSTLAKLIAGLYTPWDGEILLDGENLKEIDRSLLTRSLSFVDQNIFLFEGSFRDNITLWDETFFEEDILKAAKDSCIHEDIISSKEGYETFVLEGGKNLSGGQKQRIEIARALLKHPTLLILDETTSALDSIIEEKILQNILRRGCSLLIITHRLASIKNCDEIIVLEEGKILQKGKHESLSKEKGLYRELLQAQGLT